MLKNIDLTLGGHKTEPYKFSRITSTRTEHTDVSAQLKSSLTSECERIA